MLHPLTRQDMDRELERPSLPSIHDLFGEHLSRSVHKRPSPFSLTDLGSSLPSDNRPGSPVRLGTDLTSPRSKWGQPSPSCHSEPGFLLTTPSTASSNEQFITLPPIPTIHPSYSHSYHKRGASSPYNLLSSTRRIPESHIRSRSSSDVMITRDILSHQASLNASAKRRHTIGSSRGTSLMRSLYLAESHPREHVGSYSRNFTTSRLSSASPSSVASTLPSMSPRPPAANFSPQPSRPSSPRSATSGDDASVERRKSLPKYKCEYCGKRFNRPSSLKLHNNTHTGEKPYTCPFPGCGRSFSVMSNMRRHGRVHGTPSYLTPLERSTEDALDTASPSYSSSSSTQDTPLILQAAAELSKPYARSRHLSASLSPPYQATSLPSFSSLESRRRPSSIAWSHLHLYQRSQSPMSDHCHSSPEQ